MKWYAIFVHTGKEEDFKYRVNQQLGPSQVVCYVPKRKIPERKNGMMLDIVKTLFPGYVFIQTKMTKKIYYKIKSIPGIINMLNYRNKKDILALSYLDNEEDIFKNIPETEMENLLNLINKDEIIDYSNVLLRNNNFSIISGPLKGLEERVKKINKRSKRAKFALDFMGSEKLIDLGIEIITSSRGSNNGTIPTQNGGVLVEDIREKVEQMIIELLELPQDSVLENRFEDVGINSLSFVRLIVNIELEFGISVPDELLSLEAFPSIDDIVTYITVNS